MFAFLIGTSYFFSFIGFFLILDLLLMGKTLNWMGSCLTQHHANMKWWEKQNCEILSYRQLIPMLSND